MVFLRVVPLILAVDGMDQRSPAGEDGCLFEDDAAGELVCPDEAERGCFLHVSLFVLRVAPAGEPALLVVESEGVGGEDEGFSGLRGWLDGVSRVVWIVSLAVV